jgi:dTMP kinase
MFITLEGPDGAGKSTQAALLVTALRNVGYDVVAVHEPGGTELGDAIRAMLVRRAGPPIEPWAEALLFSACRAQLVREVIVPALRRGAVVVADRFADSTLAYQGAGRGLEREALETLVRIAVDDARPDLTLLLDVPAEQGLARLRPAWHQVALQPANQITFFEELALPDSWNRFEDETHSFHERVRGAYLDLAQSELSRWVVIDATRTQDDVAAEIWEAVRPRLHPPAS